ncbi:hypothetical protein PMAYCL1PPCAC_08741, partial [Pristionchus mayeri]
DFPLWLPWLEIAYAIPACLTCLFLFVILVRTPLSIGSKIFLYINTASLFGMALIQSLIAAWKLRNERGIGPEELHFFPLVFAYQFFYGLSTASLFTLSCERLFLCFYPTFYQTRKRWTFAALIIAILINIIYVISLTMMLQYSEFLISFLTESSC